METRISMYVMKMFRGDRIPEIVRNININGASELTNCVIGIPGNIHTRRMLIFRDPVTNVTEDDYHLFMLAFKLRTFGCV